MNIQQLLYNCNLIFDIGANIGFKTRTFLESGARVVCFEPQPECITALQQALGGNEKVTIVAKGIANRSGKMEMAICSEANTISTFSCKWQNGRFSNYSWDKTVEVEVITLNQAIQEFGKPDYCKIDVEGFEYEVLLGLSQRISLLSFEFVVEDMENAKKCVTRLQELGFQSFNVLFGESQEFYFSRWLLGDDLIDHLLTRSEPLMWGDIYAVEENFLQTQSNAIDQFKEGNELFFPEEPKDILKVLISKGLHQSGEPLRLHLGCGATQLDGYVNIDYPQEHHNVMSTKSDFSVDLTKLFFNNQVVDEIRLHHVFEHFNRVTALAMLIRWHSWLKNDGKLHIETPDIIGSSQTLLSAASFRTKMRVVRHLAGDQTADWGYHVDHWFPDRFDHTLKSLGYRDIQVRTWKWEKEPYLSNIEVTARKAENRTLDTQLKIAYDLLWESTVDDVEKPSHEIWCKQLRDFLKVPNDSFILPSTKTQEPREIEESDPAHLSQGIQATKPAIESVLREFASELPIDDIHGFNQGERDLWVSKKAKSVAAGSMVLDVGAGTCLYRGDFSHCEYKTHDFKKYEGYQNDTEGLYGEIDYVSDIKSIPVSSESFDVILCTEVLEHVPEPIEVLKEMARILKPGGRLLITAPLGSGLHQIPYHYYGGYSPFWYRHFCPKFDLKVVEIVPNGGFFKLLAQECARVAWTMPEHERLHGDNKEAIGTLFGELLPRFLFNLDEKCFIEQFTVGYHVEAVKGGSP